MIVLALNCGSSSIKFQAVDTEARHRLARGLIERLGERAHARFQAPGAANVDEAAPIPGYAEGVHRITGWLERIGVTVEAVGHRVVHGGARFVEPALVDEAVMAAIEALDELAPLHNAPSLAGIRAARAVLGGLPMVAVFDTAFHARLPPHASTYAIPEALAARHGIRRYGFHGTSYRSVLTGYGELTGRRPEGDRIIALHLGNGCSVSAIAGGRSVDTSMGLTPLEGLVMGTRAGDLDPAIVDYLARREGVTAAEVTRWLNTRSGLSGLSATSSDVRDLLAAEASDPRARLALDVFCYRARKYVGAYLAVLGGADALVFSGGIGEHASIIRARIVAGMEWCGVTLDAARNEEAVGRAARISAEGARLAAYVIPTDEERVIAEETATRLRRPGP
jgi:acetate kinase